MGKSWTVAEAKAKFSEIIERAQAEGPQTITRHGRSAVVVVAAKDWQRQEARKGSFAEFLLSSPLRGSGVKIERIKDRPRKVAL